MGEHVKRKTPREGFSSHASKKAKVAAVDESKSSSAQKRQLKKERQSHRRHAETVSEAKLLWNKLRQKSNTPDDTKKLMVEVMELIRGKVNEIALQHDASRVVQAAVQFGNQEQRKELLDEICAESAAGLAELAKIQYAHFCCLKFIKYCNRDEASIKKIVKVRYIRHLLRKIRWAQKLTLSFNQRLSKDLFQSLLFIRLVPESLSLSF